MSYDVVGLLGRGGSAVVELAVAADGRQVATKRLALTGSAAQIHVARQRLRREAEILSSLAHPGIVPIIEVIDDGSEVVLILPVLVESLDDRVSRLGPLPPVEVARIGRVLLGALAAAHRQGVVHRDIKPANVLFDHGGQPALADFGVAVTREVTAGLTQAGTVVGTPAWMSPEQARGEATGPASDVFSLAATLTFAATGEGPYGPGSAGIVMARAARNQIRAVPAAVPSALRRPLTRMLDARPDRRPSAAGVLGGLSGTLASAPTPQSRRFLTAGPLRSVASWPARLLGDPPLHRERLLRRRNVTLAVVAGLTVVLVATAVAAGLNGGDTKAQPASASKRPAPAVACVPLAYLPCGAVTDAPHTDGRVCLAGWYDLDGLPGNGCEAHSDYVAGTTLVQGVPVRANIVPASASDTFSTRVSGDAFSFCWGALRVTLTAPAQTTERLAIWTGPRQLASVISVDGTPATAKVNKPSCFGADSENLWISVTGMYGASAQDFTLSRDGGW